MHGPSQATWVLVVGYSWLDGNLQILGNPGIGWPIAWKRFVTVMIGMFGFFLPLSLPPHTLTNMLFVAFQGPQRPLS